ncbi:MAG: hypothetical protein K0R66_51 [Gammaproteobacteria bacterium]|jgi:amino acid transporter|nr:hypothetical protein [Gammaproteobacteria bacterium]
MPSSHLEKFGYKQELKRSLGLWQLIAFGLNYMIPLSPVIFFGFILAKSGGTVVLPFLLAGIAMLLTATSYITMVRHFPLAGSLYNFVRLAWNPHIGFIAGWVLLLDYLLITTVTSMSAAVYLNQLVPALPYDLNLFIFIALSGIVNLLGVNIMASIGLIILIAIEILVLSSFGVWSYAIHFKHIGTGTLLSLAPFHFTDISSLIGATSLAVASYLGFDAITTLAEEAKDPVKDIPKAILICVIFGGTIMVLTGYLAMLAIPNWHTEIQNQAWLETALFQISKMTGGKDFALLYSLGFIVSMLTFNIVATAATSRLLFGMGRDRVLNKKLFSAVNRKWKTPHWNVILIMLISFIVGSLARINQIASLVNFGALLGFAILNLSLIRFYFSHKQSLCRQYCRYLILPGLGFIIVMWVFWGLDRFTHMMGSIWLIIGLIYLGWLRRQVK